MGDISDSHCVQVIILTLYTARPVILLDMQQSEGDSDVFYLLSDDSLCCTNQSPLAYKPNFYI